MGFHEVDFPTKINYGSRGGPGYKSEIIELDSGSEEVVARWSNARRRYNAAYQIKSQDLLSDLITFYHARRGAANGFRFKDWSDYTTASNHRDDPTATDIVIGTGDGSTVNFQLVKYYTNGGVTRTRNLTKPVSGTVKVALDGVEQNSGWSVNTTNGIITFTSPPALGVAVQAGCAFMVPVRFDISIDELMEISIDDFTIGSIPDIPLVEVTDGLTISDEFFFGGSTTYDPMTEAVTVTHNNGRFLLFNPSSNLSVYLPTTTGLPGGGPHFYIKNLSGANSLLLRTSGGTLFSTVSPGATVEILLHGSTWYPK